MAFKLKGTGLYKRTASKNSNVFKHTAKFGSNTSFSEIDKVDAHNKRHKKGEKYTPSTTWTGDKDAWLNVGEWTSEKEGGDAKKPMKKVDKNKGGMFTEGTIPSHIKKAFPNLTLEQFNKDKMGYHRKAEAKLKAGEGGPKKYKK